MAWTTRCRHTVGGAIHKSKTSTKHKVTTAGFLLLTTLLLSLAGRYLRGDQREGLIGDVQNVEEEDVELSSEEDEKEREEGKWNVAIEDRDGVGVWNNLGDFSRRTPRRGVAKIFRTVDTIVSILGSCCLSRKAANRSQVDSYEMIAKLSKVAVNQT